ncbi:carbamoylphosphate synthase large subunit [Paenibacillus endophyticus]|uniref:Carbamoylphosphate synthase large subunit n=1 Tax=Paenibacillus endophyticus TaxID=1294268 RepID=A0A7W5GB95_9BACL|nr:ATP-grasp domain-containing protein [Paenibacillus endophyticus]MBB3154134.1 carbamoylphosphate synthase large subunit [Paenibacillus endophyticus]
MTRVYMNRWFSVAYHYINMIRDNPDGEAFEFYGTHPDINHMSLLASDHMGTEPEVFGREYVDFCVNFCRSNEIDIFIPRLHMEEISRYAHLFDEIGTKVMVCRDIELLDAMIEKDKFFEALHGKDLVTIPDYRVATTAEEFKLAYEELTAAGHKVCFKPTKSEGGMGFRIIDNERDPLQDIYGYVTLSTTFEQAYDTFSLTDRFEPIMVMELLEGTEYSIDCVATAEGELLAAIPRRKSTGRTYLLEESPELLDIANRIAASLRIPYAFNIQVKYNNDVPKLLEINPRMSGGLYITCLSGVNMPYLAVQTLQGKTIVPPTPQFGIQAGYVEQPLLMPNK